jgi:gluconate 2-dehydrogenase gamma chain
MKQNRSDGVSRRSLLGAIATIPAVATLDAQTGMADDLPQTTPPPASPPAAAAASSADGYAYLGLEESAFVEAMVDTMCPADALTPSGTDCGLATFIDRQLSGAFGSGDRLYMAGPWRAGKPQQGYQHPLDPRSFFSAGVVAAQRACQASSGKSFQDLAPADRDGFLTAIAAGKVTSDDFALAEWFNELVAPLFEQACFADPIYGGNRNKVFWKMIGFPGLPAFHAEDVEQYRGKPFPGAADPKSIQDFS